MLKVGLTMAVAVIVIISMFVWRFLGQPYYRLSLIGTEYIENADELAYANELIDNKLILIKKYMYSEDVVLIGFGGGGSRTDDYFSYGVADFNKNVLIEPEYQFILSKTNLKNESVIFGFPYVKKGNEKMMFYRIANGRLELTDEKASW